MSILNNRKQDLPQYKELFLALFKIKDREVQSRVLNAINGGNKSSTCKCKNKMAEDKCTQTNREDFEIIQNSFMYKPEFPINTEKRKNKRKNRGPRVEKSSPQEAKVLIKNDRTQVFIKKEETEEENDFKKNSPINKIKVNTDDISSMDDIDNISDSSFEIGMSIANEFDKPLSCEDLMRAEYQSSRKYTNGGLLPIHTAILFADISKLRRQLYVFKFLKMDSADIFVQNGNINLLQFMLLHNPHTQIFEEIYKNDCELNNKNTIFEKDPHGNNLIHLACEYLDEDLDITIFQTLLKYFKINNNSEFFQETNHNGQTVFHNCIKRNKPIFCHLLLEHINSMLHIQFDSFERQDLNRTKLAQYYINQIHKEKPYNTIHSKSIILKKSNIINYQDCKNGYTPLYQAIQSKNLLLVRILLYHLADSSIKTFGGYTAFDLCENGSKIHNLLEYYSKNNILEIEEIEKE